MIPFEESLELVRASGLPDGRSWRWELTTGAIEDARQGGEGSMKRVVVISGSGAVVSVASLFQ